MKFIHISDVHLYTKGYSFKDLLQPKRFAGWMNYTFRRKEKFIDSIEKLDAIKAFVKKNDVEGIVLSGDITCLGSEGEFALAKPILEKLLAEFNFYALIPGNHDYYTNRELYNEKFKDLTPSADFIEKDQCAVIDFGENAKVVLLNSVKPNPHTISSSGYVSESQLLSLKSTLEKLTSDRKQHVFICSHYGLRRKDGSSDPRRHGLINYKDLERVISGFNVYYLHGHIHHTYSYDIGNVQCFDAGGTVFKNREAFWLFDVAGDAVNISKVKYEGGEYVCS